MRCSGNRACKAIGVSAAAGATKTLIRTERCCSESEHHLLQYERRQRSLSQCEPTVKRAPSIAKSSQVCCNAALSSQRSSFSSSRHALIMGQGLQFHCFAQKHP